MNTGGFKFIPDTKVFEDIDSVNEAVYIEKVHGRNSDTDYVMEDNNTNLERIEEYVGLFLTVDEIWVG